MADQAKPNARPGGADAETLINPAGPRLGVVPSPLDSTPPPAGWVLAGRYEIESSLGAGAAGMVFRAFDRLAKHPVAVKLFRTGFMQDHAPAGGSRELRAARALGHPNVCRVFDLASADGHWFMTMELASGGSLRARMDDVNRPLVTRIAEARAALSGAAAIHAAGIIHRDLKPENILCMEGDRLAVSDFGLAVMPNQTTEYTGGVGTPHYMAPELLLGDRVTFRSDVFSLGVLLHEIFFNDRPVWTRARSSRRLEKSIAPRTAVERALLSLCANCLQDTPDKRPRDAGEVHRLFDLALLGRSPWRLTTPWRWIAAAAACGTVGLVAWRLLTPAPPPPGPSTSTFARPVAVGTPRDLSSVPLTFRPRGSLVCMSALPGGKAARAILENPAEAWDIDLMTGAAHPADLLPEAYKSAPLGCPRLSPDGRRLLFIRSNDHKRPSQVMLSQHPDGRDAEAVTEGRHPAWHPNGLEFVYRVDRSRVAVMTLPDRNQLLPESPVGIDHVVAISFSPDGRRLAFVREGLNQSGFFLEQRAFPSLALERVLLLPERGVRLSFVDNSTILTSGNESRALAVSVDGVVRDAFYLPNESLELLGAGGRLLVHAWHSDVTVRVLRGDQELKSVHFRGRAAPVAAVSRSGDVAVPILLDGKKWQLGLMRANEHTLTALSTLGADSPTFLGDGSDLLINGDGRTVRICRVAPQLGKCRDVHRHDLMLEMLSVAPDEAHLVAVASGNSGQRLVLIRLSDGKTEDLGPARWCRTVWTSPRTLWMPSARPDEWHEVDIMTHQATGVVTSGGDGDCLAQPKSQPFQVEVSYRPQSRFGVTTL